MQPSGKHQKRKTHIMSCQSDMPVTLVTPGKPRKFKIQVQSSKSRVAIWGLTLISASSYPFIGHHFTIMYMCANTPAFLPLSFSLQCIHDLKFLPVNRDIHPSHTLQHSAVHTTI